jgi:hypothetical protein
MQRAYSELFQHHADWTSVAKFGDDDTLVEDYRPVVVRSAHPHPTAYCGVESSKIDFLAIEPRELRLGRLVATW